MEGPIPRSSSLARSDTVPDSIRTLVAGRSVHIATLSTMRLLPRIVLFCAASGTVVTAVPVATQGDSNGRVRKANDQKWPPELVLGLLGTAVFGPPLVAKGVRMWRNRGQRGNDRQTVQQAEVQQAETQRATAQRAVSQIEAADPAAVQRLEALVRHGEWEETTTVISRRLTKCVFIELTIWDDEKLSSNCFQTMVGQCSRSFPTLD